jgi:hypothetical protein
MATAQDGAKFASLTHRPHLLPGNSTVTHSCYWLSRPQGHSAIGRITSMSTEKNPLTPSGIEPATFRFVAPYLNHSATAVPLYLHYVILTEIIIIFNCYELTTQVTKFVLLYSCNNFTLKMAAIATETCW